MLPRRRFSAEAHTSLFLAPEQMGGGSVCRRSEREREEGRVGGGGGMMRGLCCRGVSQSPGLA